MGCEEGLVTTEGRKRLLRLLDDQGWLCGICGGEILMDIHANIDHILPRSLGGPDELGNLQAAHRQCNTDKGHALVGGAAMLPCPLCEALFARQSTRDAHLRFVHVFASGNGVATNE